MTPRRPSVTVTTFLAAVAVLGLLAWWQLRASDSPPAAARDEGPPPAIELTAGDEAPTGRFILLHYPELIYGEMYDVTLRPLRVERLTEGLRVSSVGACGGEITVAAAQQAVGFTDHLQHYRGGSLVPHDGLGLLEGFTPAFDQNCRLTFTTVDRTVPGLPDELRVWDPEAKRSEVRLRTGAYQGDLAGPQWGPDGTIAIVRQEDTPDPGAPPSPPAALLVVAPDGTVTTIDPGMPALRGVTWAGGLMALEDDDGIVFYDLATRSVTARLPGWLALDWSPDGKQLLVKDAATKLRLGVVAAPADPTVVEVARATDGEIGSVVWVDE